MCQADGVFLFFVARLPGNDIADAGLGDAVAFGLEFLDIEEHVLGEASHGGDAVGKEVAVGILERVAAAQTQDVGFVVFAEVEEYIAVGECNAERLGREAESGVRGCGETESVEQRGVGVDGEAVAGAGDGDIEGMELLFADVAGGGEEKVDVVEFASFGFVDGGDGD